MNTVYANGAIVIRRDQEVRMIFSDGGTSVVEVVMTTQNALPVAALMMANLKDPPK